jgi:hypothetical protein
MLPSAALRFREIAIFTSKPLFARAEEVRVLWPGASGGFLLVCDRIERPGRGSCRARVAGVRKQGPRGARFAGGRFEGPHQEAQDCGCIRGQSGQVDSRLAGGRFEGPHQEAQDCGCIRGQSGQVDSRFAGPFGTSAWATQGLLRHNRVRDPRAPAAQPRVRFLDPFQSGLCLWKLSVRTGLVPRLPRLARLLTFGSRGMRVPDL